MRFDTHLHVWQRNDAGQIRIRERLPELDRDFSLAATQPALDAAGVNKVILVSAAQEEAETIRLLNLASGQPDLIAGVIGWLDLEAPDIAEKIIAYARHPKWLGVRLPLTIIDERRWISRATVRSGLRRLSEAAGIAEVLAAPDQLEIVADTLAELPDLRVLVDHAGNPDFTGMPTPEWRRGLVELAAHPGAICKVSAFWAPGDPPVNDGVAERFFEHVIDSFGVERVVAAANWPVSSLAGPYAASWKLLDRLTQRSGLTDAERLALLSGNASKFFAPAGVGPAT